MICSRCMARGAARSVLRRTRPASAKISTTSSRSSEAVPISPAATTSSTPQRTPPAATSTSAAQPFSTPLTYGPGIEGTPTQPIDTQPARPPSSIRAGTVLRGLNYFKGKEDPVALEDHEYPDWLWTLLDRKDNADSSSGGKDSDPRIYSKSANARRAANKRMRKAAAANPDSGIRKIPLHEQSIDLPTSTDKEAVSARQDLTKAMREQRRQGIKEANFLKGM